MSTLHTLPRPLAFVFSEGAARAAAQVGMLEVIGRTGVLPDLVVGSSTGAINAAVYAAEPLFAVDALSALWEAIAVTRNCDPRGEARCAEFPQARQRARPRCCDTCSTAPWAS